VVERNLLVGNREGFNFREQSRTTARIDNPESKPEEAIWNHDECICNNVIAYNRDAQTRGWFDVTDERHWLRKSQTQESTVSLEALRIIMTGNIYAHENNQPLFIWGTEWRRHSSYSTIEQIQLELNFEQGGRLLPLEFRASAVRDFRLPSESPVFQMDCYPRGDVPGVKLEKVKTEMPDHAALPQKQDSSFAIDALVGAQKLRAEAVKFSEGQADDLIHVVIAISGQAADEGDVFLHGGEVGILLM
jgi:hypothetical protein